MKMLKMITRSEEEIVSNIPEDIKEEHNKKGSKVISEIKVGGQCHAILLTILENTMSKTPGEAGVPRLFVNQLVIRMILRRWGIQNSIPFK